jgi:hypothetical protein
MHFIFYSTLLGEVKSVRKNMWPSSFVFVNPWCSFISCQTINVKRHLFSEKVVL